VGLDPSWVGWARPMGQGPFPKANSRNSFSIQIFSN
jgi:hypothetical protein